MEAAAELEGSVADRDKYKEKRDKERQKERAKVEKEKENDEGETSILGFDCIVGEVRFPTSCK